MGRCIIGTKLTYLVSHPIQYQAPLLRKIANEPDIDFRVLFERINPDHRYFDNGFGRDIQWDIPLTEGYDFRPLENTSLQSEISACDALWVHGWQSRTFRRAIRIAKSKGKPVLMRGENCDLAMPDGRGLKGWVKRQYLMRIFADCAAFLAIGTLNRQYYLSRGVEASRIFQMPYAIDNEAFMSAAIESLTQSKNLKQRIGIPDNAPIVLYAGKLSSRKHPEILGQAIRLLGDMTPAPVLLYVGDGELMEELKTREPTAYFTGFINQSALPSYYALADVFVLPSEKEPWGLAVNEAMACATPVIVSDQVGSAPDLVDGDTGIVFETGNSNALADAIRKCLAKSVEMGANAALKIGDWGYAQDIQGLKQALHYVKSTE